MSSVPNTPDNIRIALEQLKLHGESREERGVKIIRLIFKAFEGMGEIDQRQVVGPDGRKTYLGLAYLLNQMGLSMGRDHTMNGMLTGYVDRASDASKACDGFAVWLFARADKMFMWMELLEPVLNNDERRRMILIMDGIMEFMSDFDITVPSKAVSVYAWFKARH
jgi:hypothetical protein